MTSKSLEQVLHEPRRTSMSETMRRNIPSSRRAGKAEESFRFISFNRAPFLDNKSDLIHHGARARRILGSSNFRGIGCRAVAS